MLSEEMTFLISLLIYKQKLHWHAIVGSIFTLANDGTEEKILAFVLNDNLPKTKKSKYRIFLNFTS